MKKALIIISIILFIVLIVQFAIPAIFDMESIFIKNAVEPPSAPTEVLSQAPTGSPNPTAEITAEPTAAPEPMPQYTNIVVGFGGDIIAHEQILESAKRYDNGKKYYTFENIFKYIKPAFDYADFMVANLESPIAGASAGYSAYPSLTFNFPDEIVDALKYSGIDMVLNANNHSSDKYPEGLYRTLDMLDSADIMHTGAWRNAEERAVPTVIDVQGIKIGIVSVTYSLNGREAYISQDILDYMVCFLDEQQVKKEIDLCREYGAEIVIVSPHMGDEYQQYTREGFRNHGINYISLGADIVIAHHPHVLQASELVSTFAPDGSPAEGLCFWSIGNLMHNQVSLSSDFAKEARETGIILYLNIQKDNYTGEVTIESLEYLPVWMLRRTDFNPRLYAILPAGNEIDFTAPPYNELPLNKSNFYSLERAWNVATKQVGTEYATPLGKIPTKEESKTTEN
ncbi:MAG: CapA family protein [Eubacteriales bacterium]